MDVCTSSREKRSSVELRDRKGIEATGGVLKKHRLNADCSEGEIHEEIGLGNAIIIITNLLELFQCLELVKDEKILITSF